MVQRGSFLCYFYGLNDAEDVAHKICSGENLPNFTDITNGDKSLINKSRYNLFSLLIPIADRCTALK